MDIWESMKSVQLYCERLDLIHIVHKRNLDFSMVYFIPVRQIVLLENVAACFVGLDVLRICVMNIHIDFISQHSAANTQTHAQTTNIVKKIKRENKKLKYKI